MSQNKRFLSPRVTFGFPCFIKEPSTKFADESDPNDKGKFKVHLVMEKGTPEQIKFQENLENIWEEHLDEVCRRQNKNRKTLRLDPDHIPWVEELDRESGEATGNMIYRCNLKARVVKKDQTFYDQRPKVFDGSGVLLKTVPNIGPGSQGKVSGEIFCYSTGKIGMSLRLQGVQLFQLVESQNFGDDAEDYGFSDDAGEGDFKSSGEFEAAVADGQPEGDF